MMKTNTIKNNNTKSGYTIIETMIAISVFLVVVMLGIGALLNASVLHQKARDTRSILDNLSFVMEDMARNLRVGSNYHCIAGSFELSNLALLAAPKSANSCVGIAFLPAPTNGIPNPTSIYYIDPNLNGVQLAGAGTAGIFKSVDAGVTWVQLNPDEVNMVTQGAQYFDVLGALPPSGGDKQQPFVNIRLFGTITTKGVITPFSLQTSVSQRTIDI